MVHQSVASVTVHVEEILIFSIMTENFSINIQDSVSFQKKEFLQQQIITQLILAIIFTIRSTHPVDQDQMESIALMDVHGGMLTLFGKHIDYIK